MKNPSLGTKPMPDVALISSLESLKIKHPIQVRDGAGLLGQSPEISESVFSRQEKLLQLLEGVEDNLVALSRSRELKTYFMFALSTGPRLGTSLNDILHRGESAPRAAMIWSAEYGLDGSLCLVLTRKNKLLICTEKHKLYDHPSGRFSWIKHDNSHAKFDSWLLEQVLLFFLEPENLYAHLRASAFLLDSTTGKSAVRPQPSRR